MSEGIEFSVDLNEVCLMRVVKLFDCHLKISKGFNFYAHIRRFLVRVARFESKDVPFRSQELEGKGSGDRNSRCP